uniref:GRIP domain-containing protein n=1 Tax=Pseudo-nitzschia delicatissima TaxID=44447 RepID=A0A7S0TDE5_9STRA|mmetsp:Transcript_300/g.641  ORF Transcript_300/g.641 Transcript_300/m.641 type:complete len:940 (+) Transcript_300:159-2978(+)|eukprot:CAMPEP_0116078604 /NCGR_PEP_ID=MMETSP0327-20121206/697_1 /TAXON_ID=44447 /ORGANISM="Pseudo-nitzschia delicatissima, Strain B596" /LENGTH=939 /DNA_ID=CAMNT_0003569173 /DNA_START=135 /DNA_END=2954 /DNA_ORIENTATION=+
MWGNLAGRLGATDINATLEKIGNAVAPREDSDDDEYSDDADYDDDGDYDEDYGLGDGEAILKKVAGASPFRLAGMLTQALDNRNVAIGDSEESDNNSYRENSDITGNKMLFPSEPVRIEQEIVPSVDTNDTGNDCPVDGTTQIQNTLQQADKPVQIPSQPPVTISDTIPNNASTQDSTPKVSGEKSKDTFPNGTDVREEDVGFESQKELEMKHSPYNTTTMESKVSNSMTMDKVATVDCSLSRSDDIVGVDNNFPIAKTPVELKESQDIPNSLLGVNSAIVMGEKTKDEEEKFQIRKDDHKVDKEEHSESTVNIVHKKEKNQMRVVGDGDTNVTTQILSNVSKPESIKPTDNKDVSALSGRKECVEVNEYSMKKMPDNVAGSDENGGAIRNIVKGSSAETDALIEIAAQSRLSSNDETPIHAAKSAEDNKVPYSNEEKEHELLKAEMNCQELKIQLREAKQKIEALRNQAKCDKEKVESEKEDLIAQFHSKEVRLLQATSEENQNQTLLLEQEYSAKIQNLENSLVTERKSSQEEQEEYKRLLRESYSNVDRMEKQLNAAVHKHEMEINQVQQREERALRKVDDRMAQTMAVLDERDEEIKKLKKSIKAMESKVNEHQEGEEEAEEELEEIHQENESLRETIEKLELEKNNLKDQVATLKSGSEELPGLQMELTMLREERNRERTKNQAVMDSAMSSRTQLETERDNALSELRDSKQQLAATLGDLEISRADYSRIIMANENLQSALEAFQDERRAEMEMIDEQRRESEEALKSAHATATSAMKQIHENEMYEIQKASDNAVKNVMHEMELVEGNLEKLKSENNQMRRSLDEAIHRLQTTQEDVIDRNVMKNILLDWCTLNDKTKRHQVLQVMANLLHFSEEEKEKVHLTSKSLDSVRTRVVGALAAPLPPSKADVEHLEGSNVHEKWVNFLMAETDDA